MHHICALPSDAFEIILQCLDARFITCMWLTGDKYLQIRLRKETRHVHLSTGPADVQLPWPLLIVQESDHIESIDIFDKYPKAAVAALSPKELPKNIRVLKTNCLAFWAAMGLSSDTAPLKSHVDDWRQALAPLTKLHLVVSYDIQRIFEILPPSLTDFALTGYTCRIDVASTFHFLPPGLLHLALAISRALVRDVESFVLPTGLETLKLVTLTSSHSILAQLPRTLQDLTLILSDMDTSDWNWAELPPSLTSFICHFFSGSHSSDRDQVMYHLPKSLTRLMTPTSWTSKFPKLPPGLLQVHYDVQADLLSQMPQTITDLGGSVTTSLPNTLSLLPPRLTRLILDEGPIKFEKLELPFPSSIVDLEFVRLPITFIGHLPPNLRVLSYENGRLNAEALAKFPQQSLRTLTAPYDFESANDLDQLPSGITDLFFQPFPSVPTEPDWIKPLLKLKNLQKLTMRHNAEKLIPFPDQCFHILSGFTALTHLVIEYAELYAEQLRNLPLNLVSCKLSQLDALPSASVLMTLPKYLTDLKLVANPERAIHHWTNNEISALPRFLRTIVVHGSADRHEFEPRLVPPGVFGFSYNGGGIPKM